VTADCEMVLLGPTAKGLFELEDSAAYNSTVDLS
jgi:SHS2 domain-containing protein